MKFADRAVYVGFQALLQMLSDDCNEGIDESLGEDWKSYLSTRDTALASWNMEKVELPYFTEVPVYEKYRGDSGDSMCPDWKSLGISEETGDTLCRRGFHIVKQEFYSKSDLDWLGVFGSEREWNPEHASEYMVIVGSTDYSFHDTLCFWVLEKVTIVS